MTRNARTVAYTLDFKAFSKSVQERVHRTS